MCMTYYVIYKEVTSYRANCNVIRCSVVILGFRVTFRVELGLGSGVRVGLGSGVRVGFRVRVRIMVRVGFSVVLGLNLVQGCPVSSHYQ